MAESQYFAWIVLAAMVVPTDAWASPPPATRPTEEELLDQVRALRAEVKDLRSRLDAKQPTTQPTTQSQPAAVGPSISQVNQQMLHDADHQTPLFDVTGLSTAYVPDKGALIRSDDGNFLLHPWAFIQARYTANYRENAKSAGGGSDWENGFELPRMKFIMEGNIYGPDLTYQFIWASSDTTGNLFLQDAWARYHIPGTPFAFQGGQLRDPVDHEQIMFATRSLTPERSIVNNVMLNSDDIVKGVEGSYGFDGEDPLRAELAFTSGMRNSDTTFQGFPTNPADWGFAGRIEWKVTGAWNDYSQFTALGDKQPLLVFGGGFDYTEAGPTADFIQVADVQFNTPGALTLYGAFLGRYTRNNAGPPGTNGTSATGGAHPDTYDATARFMAAYLFGRNFEPFFRYEYLHFARSELPAIAAHTYINAFTLGANYYFYGHRAKFSGNVEWLPSGSPISNTGADLLSNHGGNEFIVQVQFQLII